MRKSDFRNPLPQPYSVRQATARDADVSLNEAEKRIKKFIKSKGATLKRHPFFVDFVGGFDSDPVFLPPTGGKPMACSLALRISSKVNSFTVTSCNTIITNVASCQYSVVISQSKVIHRRGLALFLYREYNVYQVGKSGKSVDK